VAALGTSAYVAASRDAVANLLRGMLDDLFDAAAAEAFSTAPAVGIGRGLVAEHFTGEESLSRTIEVLGRALLADDELRGIAQRRGVQRMTERVVALLGGLAAGYAAALRATTLDQQETVKQALLKASRDAERELRMSEVRFRELFASSAVGIAISDLDGKLLEVNEALGEIVGRPAIELVGLSLQELFHPDDAAQLAGAHQRLVDAELSRRRLEPRLRLMCADGDVAWAHLAISVLRDSEGRPTRQVTMVDDVTALHLLGERLNHQSLHDALTGLPNQVYFLSRLESVVGRANPTAAIALFKIDLDGFTVVNEGLGRRVGDQLLRSVAARLLAMLADEKATVARFGDDEFAILLERTPTSPDVAAVAARINSELAEPVFIGGAGVAVSACIGVVEHRGGAIDPAELLRAAEATLRRVKSGGTRQWGCYDQHRDADQRARSRLAAAMAGAWESGEIGLEYQPLVRLADRAVLAVEARLRWDHPKHGPLKHRTCLELAAETGLVLPMGEWLLRTAGEQLAWWHAAPHVAAPSLHVDLAAQQALDPDLVSVVRGALGAGVADLRLGVPVRVLGGASDAGLEAGPDPAAVEARDGLRALADLGVTLVLVEYGGIADLAHLEDLPVRALRVAEELRWHVTPRPYRGSLVAKAIPDLLALAHSCGATVAVGGLDTEEQVAWWRSVGADIGQGCCLAPAVPAAGVLPLLVSFPLPTDHER
jgi:diguanylate cyclase (GGDEF)-like protein/PAS domain S-box-containing protein